MAYVKAGFMELLSPSLAINWKIEGRSSREWAAEAAELKNAPAVAISISF